MSNTGAGNRDSKLGLLRPIDALRGVVAECAAGPVPEELRPSIERLLMDAWDGLIGSNIEGMAGRKVLARTERMVWQPPILSFVIERHGALVGGGSTRGELQRWQINTLTAETECSRTGHRQLRPASRPLKLTGIADDVVGAIVRHEANNPAVVWLSDNRVRVIPSQIAELQSGFKQTVEGRRKRFIAAVDGRLAELGWSRASVQGRFVYEHQVELADRGMFPNPLVP
jgi:hypothetical protein